MDIINELESLANTKKAKKLQGFFKTGPGQYGESDIFLGIVVPEQRKIAKKYFNLNLDEIQQLLDSRIHEHRLSGLFILISKYKKTKGKDREDIFDFYMHNAKKGNIDNWDLVDLSAPNIVGDFLEKKNKGELYTLAKSENLWEKRIAILSTFHFIRQNQFDDTLKLSELLLKDKHDLIHKAVGWMLREVGKRDKQVLTSFLNKHYKNMPRTMLRYSIEKFDDSERKEWLRR